jgi:coenzyme F420-0:L-glutamate ligase/coenzyme F420-1:gamma-L-glutamate ligase
VKVEITGIAGLPEVGPGDDLGLLLASRLAGGAAPGDILVVAHKVVSKAEGRLVRLADVQPSPRAEELAATHDKDPRAMEVVLRESAEVVRAERGVLIARTRHGFVCANAGVDASNAGDPDTLVLLPLDPDASARRLRAAVPGRPAVVITDSFGRAWRHGQVDVAIGLAGLAPLEDWRGRPDAAGRLMRATWLAVADMVAAAGDLVRTKDAGTPAALVRGLGRHVTEEDGPGVTPLLRGPDEDLFR